MSDDPADTDSTEKRDMSATASSALSLSTLCAHGGEPRFRANTHVSAIHQQTVFDFSSVAAASAAVAGEGYVYRRNGMPNADELGAAVARLEGADAGQATSSGMGAIAATVLGLCRTGDVALVQRDAYGGTTSLFDAEMTAFGLEVSAVDVHDLDSVTKHLDGARVLVVESLSNPLLRVAPIQALARLCRDRGVILVVDNTFATPLAIRPIDLGAHLVVHSATKFLGGHHDACAGVVVGDEELVHRVAAACRRVGLIVAPFDAWLVVRGLRTLDVRMQRAVATAQILAARLQPHSAVQALYSNDECALVSFELGSLAAAEQFVCRCSLITLSPSLGGVTTTLSHPATSSHVGLSEAARRVAGIGDGLLRMCVGLESPRDLWSDITQALGN